MGASGLLLQAAYFFRLLKKWHSIPAGMEWSFHSGWNEASIPTGMEWLHSIPARMEWPFHSIQNGIAMRVTNVIAVTL